MRQGRLASLLESLAQTAVGFILVMIVGPWIYARYGHEFSRMDNIKITLWFTALSIARGYAIRRFYEFRAYRREKHGNRHR